MRYEKYFYFNIEEQATIVKAVQGSETLTLTANQSGASGNLISCIIDVDTPLASVNTPSISVSGNQITVGVGDASGAGAQDAAAAINAHAVAGDLVAAVGSADTGIAADVSEFFIAGGEDSLCIPVSNFLGMAPAGATTIDLFFKSLNNEHADGSNEEVISDKVTLTVASNTDLKDVMADICDGITSATGGYGFDVLAALDSNNLNSSSKDRAVVSIEGVAKTIVAANS
jgi:hypothetical protein